MAGGSDLRARNIGLARKIEGGNQLVHDGRRRRRDGSVSVLHWRQLWGRREVELLLLLLSLAQTGKERKEKEKTERGRELLPYTRVSHMINWSVLRVAL